LQLESESEIIDLEYSEYAFGTGAHSDVIPKIEQQFLVCEVMDQGKLMSGTEIRKLLTPPSQDQINNPAT
jgi:hypothetical protein